MNINLQDLIKTANQNQMQKQASEQAIVTTMAAGARLLADYIKTAAMNTYGYQQPVVNPYEINKVASYQQPVMDPYAVEAEIIKIANEYGVDPETVVKIANEEALRADMYAANLMKIAEEAEAMGAAPAAGVGAGAAPANPEVMQAAAEAGAQLDQLLSDPNLLNDPEMVEKVKQMLAQLDEDDIAVLATQYPVVNQILQSM